MPDGFFRPKVEQVKNREECAVVFEGLDYLIKNHKPIDVREEKYIEIAKKLRARFSECKGEF